MTRPNLPTEAARQDWAARVGLYPFGVNVLAPLGGGPLPDHPILEPARKVAAAIEAHHHGTAPFGVSAAAIEAARDELTAALEAHRITCECCDGGCHAAVDCALRIEHGILGALEMLDRWGAY